MKQTRCALSLRGNLQLEPHNRAKPIERQLKQTQKSYLNEQHLNQYLRALACFKGATKTLFPVLHVLYKILDPELPTSPIGAYL